MYVNPVRVAGRLIGNGNPSFIAAEIGINHNGDMDLAVKMIDAAVESDVIPLNSRIIKRLIYLLMIRFSTLTFLKAEK